MRILVPLACGILIHPAAPFWQLPSLLILVAAIGYLWIHHISQQPNERLRWRPFLIAPLSLCALALGWGAAIIHEPAHIDTSLINGKVLTGRVVGLDYTDFSMRLKVDVLDHDLPQCKVLVSTRGCDYTMQAGDLVAWPAELIEVSNLGNPDEMDYASYLLHSEGIRYQQHLPVATVKKIGHSPTLFTRLTNLRRQLQLKIFNTSISPSSQHFIVALLLGDQSVIDKDTRQDFSAAGVAHILALSGLHIGVITLIIWWLLFPLDYMRLKKCRLLITLAAIALFAVFTGLSPSVVRSTIMIGLVFAAQFYHRRSVSFNALAVAALLILIFKPSAIYSVGFQLSFITVAAIVLFARVPQSLESKHQWVNHFTSTIITSLVAMLATIALSAHYFHTISLMSVLSNLFILPVLPVFMSLGALFLLVTVAGMHWPVLNCAIDTINDYIHWIARTVKMIPGSHWEGIYVSTFGIIIYFAIITLVAMWLYRRRYSYLIAAGVALAVLLGHSLWVDVHTPRQGLVVLSSFTSTPVLSYSNGQGLVWTPDGEDTDSSAFVRFYAGFIARHGINHLKFIDNNDTIRTSQALIKPPLAYLMGHRILAVGNSNWKNVSSPSHRLALDEIIITSRYRGDVEPLLERYRFDRMVISVAHQESRRLRHEGERLRLQVDVGYCELSPR